MKIRIIESEKDSFTNNLPIICAVWIGSELGAIARCCLRSFVMRGHTVHLYAYGKVVDLPEGVVLQDANKVVLKEKIIKHRQSGSYALFSDLFRYKLLQKIKTNIVYVDCDVYCLKPLKMTESGYALAYEDDNYINGAVLALPSDSNLLHSLLEAAENPLFIPPWFSRKEKRRLRIKKRFGFGRKLEDMPWGVIGPRAITHYVKNLGIEKYIQPADIYYPVHYTKVKGYLLDPDLQVEDVITNRTQCFHLYNEMLRKVDLRHISPTSILYKMLQNEI
ncbi:glycosyltransferase family 32 protein [Ignatzschineria sp. LJL83]